MYDAQIALLTNYPSLIKKHWVQAIGLFRMVGHEAKRYNDDCGCPSMIRGGRWFAMDRDGIDTELTERIKKDKRIPGSSKGINVKNLIAFKEIQELADERYRR